MSIEAESFLVFETYRDAGGHAFSKGIVGEDDKDRYEEVFQHLRRGVNSAIFRSTAPEDLDSWNCRFNRDGGIQGQRPLDLWASIINRGSDDFSRFPQIYVIASENGVEVGFSVTIHEDDYFNAVLRRRNRSIIPIINGKLPAPESQVVADIQSVLSSEPAWKFGEKARQGPISSFDNLPELIAYLKAKNGLPKGGGSVYRLFSFDEVAGANGKLEDEIAHTLNLFRPLMQMLQPSLDEAQFARTVAELAELGEQLPEFDPESEEEGKAQILRAVSVRQGQGKFRDDLLQAYKGKCAITGCSQAQVLQAAHISPYNGAKSNHVSNGLPLRADIHTLFDMGLLQIDPESRAVSIATSLWGSEYEQFAGTILAEPIKPAHRPSRIALQKKLRMFMLNG